MGSGKTTVGKALADVLNRGFVDMDERLGRRFGKTITGVFRDHGEAFFRNAESRLLRELTGRKGLVIATGGGILEQDRNRSLMARSGEIVFLDASLETCRKRLDAGGQAGRPLWTEPKSLKERFWQRQPLYRKGPLSVTVDDLDPGEVLRAVLERLAVEKRLPISLGTGSSRTICTWRAAEVLEEHIRERRTFILTDRTVAGLHLGRFSKAIQDAPTFVIPPGERNKTLRTARRIYEAMLGKRMERGDLFVAIGGGVVTDLGAFVAATYKRGMPFVLVSTTLLGCVDAAIGGKAAVDVGTAKNVVGCFTVPEAVILDVPALKTLPRKQVIEGISEAYKAGLVHSEPLVRFVEEELPSFRARDLRVLHGLVSLAAKAKGDVVSRDYREQGLRRILNFGHTIGHAIEGHGSYRITHGQAVALGMVVATRLSLERGLLPSDVAGRIMATLRRLVPPAFPCPPLEELWGIMENDKKVHRGKVVFVFLEDIARPVIADDVSRGDVERAMGALREL